MPQIAPREEIAKLLQKYFPDRSVPVFRLCPITHAPSDKIAY